MSRSFRILRRSCGYRDTGAGHLSTRHGDGPREEAGARAPRSANSLKEALK